MIDLGLDASAPWSRAPGTFPGAPAHPGAQLSFTDIDDHRHLLSFTDLRRRERLFGRALPK